MLGRGRQLRHIVLPPQATFLDERPPQPVFILPVRPARLFLTILRLKAFDAARAVATPAPCVVVADFI